MSSPFGVRGVLTPCTGSVKRTTTSLSSLSPIISITLFICLLEAAA
eukprot:gene5420-3905_t